MALAGTKHRSAGRVTTVVGYEDIPPEIRALSPLAMPDYADLFTAEIDSPLDAAPEDVIRDVFTNAPAWIRTSVPFVQSKILGVELHTPAFGPGHIIGFEIAGRGDNWLRLEAHSPRLGTAHLVGAIDGDRLSVATFIKYTSPLSGVLWTPVSVLHRLVAQVLVGRAVS